MGVQGRRHQHGLRLTKKTSLIFWRSISPRSLSDRVRVGVLRAVPAAAAAATPAPSLSRTFVGPDGLARCPVARARVPACSGPCTRHTHACASLVRLSSASLALTRWRSLARRRSHVRPLEHAVTLTRCGGPCVHAITTGGGSPLGTAVFGGRCDGFRMCKGAPFCQRQATVDVS